MPCNRLPRIMKHYSPTGRRNYGRPLKRLLDTWDRNGSTSGPTAWQIYDDDKIIAFILNNVISFYYPIPFNTIWNFTNNKCFTPFNSSVQYIYLQTPSRKYFKLLTDLYIYLSNFKQIH
jgi:hypothetical protein